MTLSQSTHRPHRGQSMPIIPPQFPVHISTADTTGNSSSIPISGERHSSFGFSASVSGSNKKIRTSEMDSVALRKTHPDAIPHGHPSSYLYTPSPTGSSPPSSYGYPNPIIPPYQQSFIPLSSSQQTFEFGFSS